MKKVKLNEAGLRRMVRGMLNEMMDEGGINQGSENWVIEELSVNEPDLGALKAELARARLAYIVHDGGGSYEPVRLTVFDPDGQPLGDRVSRLDLVANGLASRMEQLNMTGVARAVAHRPSVPNRRVGGGPHAPEMKTFSFPN